MAVTKALLSELDPFQISFYTRITSSLALVVIIAFLWKKQLFRTWRAKDVVKMSALGIIGTAVPFIMITAALTLSPAVEVTILSYLWPVFFLVFNLLIFKSSLSRMQMMSLALAVVGAYLVITSGNGFYFQSSLLPGYSLSVLGAAAMGFFAACMKNNNFSGISCLLIFNLASIPFFGVLLMTNSRIVLPSSQALLLLGILGVFINGLGYLIYFTLLRKEPDIANIIYLIPFVNLLFLNVFFNFQISMFSLVGLIIILLSIVIQKGQTTWILARCSAWKAR